MLSSKKVHKADPLICPRCGGPLKIISLIDSARVIKRILRHSNRGTTPSALRLQPPRDPYTMILR
jgi:hypothetical protein